MPLTSGRSTSRRFVLGARLFAGTAVAALAFALAGCSAPATPSPSAAASQPAASVSMQAARTGTFAGLNQKKVQGTVMIDGSQLSLSGFSSDEGPDLHVYLTNGTDEAAVSAGKQISAIMFNQTSQAFSLNGIDTSGYTNVVIHCDKAKAVFGAATLS